MNKYIKYSNEFKSLTNKIKVLNGGDITKPAKSVLITFDGHMYNVYNIETNKNFIEFLNYEFFEFLAKELNINLKGEITISAEHFLKEIMGF